VGGVSGEGRRPTGRSLTRRDLGASGWSGPTGCPSPAARLDRKHHLAESAAQKRRDLAREVIGCMGVLGRSGSGSPRRSARDDATALLELAFVDVLHK
jgi:hypothetical protein